MTMTSTLFMIISTYIYIVFLCSCTGHAQKVVACVGDSITEGYGVDDRATESYPSRLQYLLGADVVVQNFGGTVNT